MVNPELFEKMSFEELMTCPESKNEKYNNALWEEQAKRMETLQLVEVYRVEGLESFQDDLDDRLKKLERTVSRLLTILSKEGIGTVEVNLKEWVEREA